MIDDRDMGEEGWGLGSCGDDHWWWLRCDLLSWWGLSIDHCGSAMATRCSKICIYRRGKGSGNRVERGLTLM